MKKVTFDLNFLEQKPRLFFLGIGGVSMSSLAFSAKRMGCSVSGYDKTPSEITHRLEEEGIAVYHSFDPSHYKGIDCIVYTGAIRDDDENLSYPREKGIPEMTRGRFLGLLMKKSENPIGVAGTHGKSSTTGMLSSIFLSDPLRDPTVMVGAELPELGGFYRLGDGEDYIFEACEYQNSFLEFFPKLAVILNAEHDHADFFPTREDVIASFVRFADLAKNGWAIVHYDNKGAREVAEKTKSPVFFFSKTEKKDLWCENLKNNNGFYSFDIVTQSGFYTSCTLSVPGLHNVENALAAASAAFLSGVSPEAAKSGLERFRGVKRRFEYRGKCGKIQVFDDYAHHPDEIRATLTSAKEMGFEKVTVVFQPHTFTRTRAYWDDFVSALSLADRVILSDIYPAREKPILGIDAPNLALACPNGEYLGDDTAIAEHLKKSQDSGLLIIMGAGTIVHLTDQILSEEPTA